MSSNSKGREALLQLDDVGLVYQGSHGPQRVLQHISLSLDEGQHLTVVGPSGCGKSSLLRLIAGLQAPTEGQIRFDGQKMIGPRPDLAIVFQDYGLFPWKTVEENIRLPGQLHHHSLNKDQLEKLLQSLDLTAVRKHYPGELSGGQKQRTALGRAMAMQPKLLLMDEPFSALDLAMRHQCYDLFRKYIGTSSMATIIVTHSPEEAAALGDKTVVFAKTGGVIEDVRKNE
ncbi:ABC transporter ATP-binding protein [Megasphaera elsdenii]|jgi:ABC-type nitrate/sulfonate/bicarbonate transport system ATPase subunit|uniref:ABC transporter ATP-binding protein n=1 Tax=Megasphaera elsdenii TaxID=907 RepID=UPI00266F7BDD|nr:ATP-binding cassette domain-containing protein [Megasphaera elsdenii]MCI7200774.1 ATP-binding cassette domain-containing protein [Megasphaera elsdenii]MDY4264303.1 ATP-binding cassette domain-containing protein [Megasphaera elsdenii]